MLSLRLRNTVPIPSLTAFIALQCLDILTTILGMELGAGESSIFIGRLMHAGPIAALLIAKLFAVLFVAAALKYNRPRVVVMVNYWFAAVVTWNLVIILIATFRR